MCLLKANHIYKSYQTAGASCPVLTDLSLQLNQGEIIAIMGPSGSGKTTLLNILSGVDSFDSGEIWIKDKDMTGLSPEETALFRRRHFGMIFQDFQLLESLSVKENILLPLILEKEGGEVQERKLKEILSILHLEALAEKGITEISGGQKQRTAIARAFIHNPELIFADEPTGNLDVKSTENVMRCMVHMNELFGTSMIVVTHDMYAASFCHRVLILKDGRFSGEISRNHPHFSTELIKMLSQWDSACFKDSNSVQRYTGSSGSSGGDQNDIL